MNVEEKKSCPEVPSKPNLAKARHSLRTPVNHIIGYAEILLEEGAGTFPIYFLKDLEKIQSGGHTLLAIINRYLGDDSYLAARMDYRGLSLELRTPVNDIIGYAELLSEQCEQLDQLSCKQDLAKIVAAGKTWLELMEEHFASISAFHAESSEALSSAQGPRGIAAVAVLPHFPAPETSLGGHVLVADDDEANRDLLTRRLEKLGYRITTCNNGADALRLAREVTPNLILLDMLMPVLNGDEALVRLKSDNALRHVPVVMISALDQIGAAARCIELGAEDYLAKPFDAILLKSRVEATLEKARLREREQIYLKRIEEERARSDRLLLNILPHPIATRLKNGEQRVVNSFEEVTVLFSDLVGFTSLAAQTGPSVLLQLLDEVFSAFDELADLHRVEKIKTIGDAYMAAAGLPLPHEDHAFAVAKMSLDMHAVMERFNRKSAAGLQMRIGICTGPVIAGIIGQKKFIYDLWGDTVNLASRMESNGMPGKTQVTETTYALLRDRFRFEERGYLNVKGKGAIKTYFLRAD